MTDKHNSSDQKNSDDSVEIKINDEESTAQEATDESSAEPELTDEEVQQEKIAELEDRLIRTVAEFDNYKKRVARQYDSMVANAKEKVIGDLLEVVDNFSRAMHEENNGDSDAFKEGVKLIYNQMNALLDKYDVKPIESVGFQFDPNLHEALMQVDSADYEAGTIALEVSKGYMMGEKVIRHAKVGVSKGPNEPAENETNKE